MANDSEFCIPLQFLNDDDVSRSVFPSYLSSPVESFLGSTTESDEEDGDGVTELTRLMAHSTLELNRNSKAMFVTGSPQSTLNGSVLCQNQATWDLLRAAEEVESMCLNEEEAAAYRVLRNTRKPSPFGVGFYPQQPQLQIAQSEMMKRLELVKQEEISTCSYGNWVNHQMVPNDIVLQRRLGLSASAWPSLQYANQHPQFGSGMMPSVFPGNAKERNGTGVFFPSFKATVEARKKLVCSSKLVQDRVAHAMNVKGVVGGKKQQKNRVNGTSNTGNGNASGAVSRSNKRGAVSRSNNKSAYGFPHQKRTVRTQSHGNHEIKLPQEWTY